MSSSSKTVSMLLLCACLLGIVSEQLVAADKLIGSCVLGAIGYVPNCNSACIRRGYEGGYCGNLLLVNCYCMTYD